MKNTVNAAVLAAPGKIEIRTFKMPKLGKGAAIGRVVAAGICGTDKHTYRGESVQYKGTSNEINIPYPIIQGHENVLVIEEIDEECARNLEFGGTVLRPGDRVTMCPDVVCGTCWFCKNFLIIHGVTTCFLAMAICVPVTMGITSMAVFRSIFILNPVRVYIRCRMNYPTILRR